MHRKPEILVFAGPNGSGKSTITQNVLAVGAYINADDIQKKEKISVREAAEQATALREKCFWKIGILLLKRCFQQIEILIS